MEPATSAETFVTSLSDTHFAFKPVSAILPPPFSPCFIPLFLLSLLYLYADFHTLCPGSVSSVLAGVLPLFLHFSIFAFPWLLKRRQRPKPFFSYHFYYVTPLIKSLKKLQTQDFIFFPPMAECYQHVQHFLNHFLKLEYSWSAILYKLPVCSIASHNL